MEYRFAPRSSIYEHLASGRVIHSRPGAVAFPARLGLELFDRACSALLSRGREPPFHLYDPVCGGGYLLTTIALLRPAVLARISASDIDPDILALGRANLALCTKAGLETRRQEIRRLLDLYGKKSHADALASVTVLERLRNQQNIPDVGFEVFQADATNSGAIAGKLGGHSVDIVVADVPYGFGAQWRTEAGVTTNTREQIASMATALLPILNRPAALVVCTADKGKISHDGYRVEARLSAGKRKITMLIRE